MLSNNHDLYAYSPHDQPRLFVTSVLPGCDFVLATVRNIYGNTILSLDSNYTSGPLQWSPLFNREGVQAILVSKADKYYRTGFWTLKVLVQNAADYVAKFSCITMDKVMNMNIEPTIVVIPQNHTVMNFEQYIATRGAYIGVKMLHGQVRIEIMAGDKVLYSTYSNGTANVRLHGPETIQLRLTKLSQVADIAIVDLMLTSSTGPVSLAAGQLFQSKRDGELDAVYKFKVYNSRSSNSSLRLIAESCDSSEAPSFCSSTTQYPLICAQNPSTSKSRYVQEYVYPTNPSVPFYFVSTNASSFIFRVDSIDQDNPLTRASRTIDGYAENLELLKLRVKDPFASNSTIFTIRIRPVGPFHTSDMNFETYCVLQYALVLPILQQTRFSDDTVELTTVTPLSGVKYVLNIIANPSDFDETMHIFEPVWYLNGVIYPIYQYVRVPISIGMLVIGWYVARNTCNFTSL